MEQGDANAKVLRVRALLKRGGKTPVYNTIVRTENVVATSDDLKGLALATEESHRQLAELYDNRDQKGVVHAIGAVRVSVGQSYGLAKEGRSVPCVDAPAPTGSWPPAYAVTPCGNMAVHGTRLAALCKSFATKHRLETNAENDVGHAICDTVSHLQESYEELDDEVFRNGPVRKIRPCTQGMTTATAWGFQALVEIGIIPHQPPAWASDDRSFLAGMGAGVYYYPCIIVSGVRV